MSFIQSHMTGNGGARAQPSLDLRAWPFPRGQASILTGEGYGEDPTRGRITVELEQDLVG